MTESNTKIFSNRPVSQRVLITQEFLNSFITDDIMAKAFNQAPRLDLYLRTNSNKLNAAASSLTSKMRNTCGKNFHERTYNVAIKLLLENFIKFQLHPFISISFDNADYKIGIAGTRTTGRSIGKVIEFLCEQGYLNIFMGSKKVGLTTRIQATPILKMMMENSDLLQIRIRSLTSKPIIALKDYCADKGKQVPIAYKASEMTNEMKAQICRINSFYDLHKFELNEVRFFPNMRRSFCDGKWDRGGRVYDHYQNIKANLRSSFKINGLTTIERDFACNHFNIQYILETSKPFQGDVYELPELPTISLLPGEKDKRRDFIKIAYQIMINTESRKGATVGIAKRLNDHNTTSIQKFKIALTAKQIIDAILTRNQTLKDCFFKNKGPALQFIDSQIALKIIELGIKDSIPVLSVHDSFICSHDHEIWLLNAMEAASKAVLGEALPIKGLSIEECRRAS